MSIFALFDFVANVLAAMDGVGATVALAGDIAHGGELVGYELPDSADVSGRRLRRELEAAGCLLYTSPSPRDRTRSRMPSSA